MPGPIPLWPGVHQLPLPDAPFPVRWSYEAWEGAYGEPLAPHWKPWPHDAEEHMFLQGFVNTYEPKPPPTGAEIWENILALYKQIEENGTLRPQAWPDLRKYVCPGCMRPQYEAGYCGFCRPAWIAAHASKPYTLPPIIIL